MTTATMRMEAKAHSELSVIVPTYNEAAVLPALMKCLASQRDVNFELIVSDGGSTDATCKLALALGERHGLAVSICLGGKGRGEQLNRGAAGRAAEYLLFLHADSRFAKPDALRTAVDAIVAAQRAAQSDAIAGHFELCFARSTTTPSLPYYFYECKARLDRMECTHGDQGLLLPRSFFERIGPFSEFPPMLAETRLADRVREIGTLLLIPAEIFTSARRFETEGLYERQVLNAILMCCASQDWDEPFRTLAAAYRTQSETGRLQLSPLLSAIRRSIAGMPAGQRRRFWWRTGGYVRRNAWQLAFLLDVRRGFRSRQDPGELRTTSLRLFDRYWDRCTENVAGQAAAVAATWLWFALTRLRASQSAG